MQDKDGKKMTDAYLIEKISIDHPVLKSVYEHTSGYVHLSDKHIFNSLGKKSKDGEFGMKVGPTDDFITETVYLEAARAFFEITGILFSYLQGWYVAKDGPQKPRK